MQRNIKNKKSTKQRTVPMFEGDPFDRGDPKYEQPLYTVDRSNMLKHGNNGAAEYINSCIETTELIDIWRELYPDRHGYTWHR